MSAQEATGDLIELAQSEDVELSSWATYALSLIGSPEATGYLAQVNEQEALLAAQAIEEKIIEEKRRRAFLRGR